MIEITSPATGAAVGQVPALTASEVEALVARARAAQAQWKTRAFSERTQLMVALRKWIVAHRDRIAKVHAAETGGTRNDALLELFQLCSGLTFWAKHARGYLREERRWARNPLLIGRRVLTRYEPLGVIGVIAPWNYPLVLGLGDAVPALMAGNTVVLKPSSVTPLSTQLVVEEGMRAAGFPADACLVATGPGTTGGTLVDCVDGVMFTGSETIGRRVGEQAGRKLIPATLELGGKDPMIVLADADLERAANVAVLWAMHHAGQTCMAVERVYVEADVYDDFVERVVTKVRAIRPSDIGPLTGPGQVDIVASHVDEAVRSGARVLVGGRRDGNRYAPTVLVDVDPEMACMTEETFGPTLPIVKIRDAEEALAHANASTYGLNASVFTRDVARGEALARRMESGSCCVNDAVASFGELSAPFAGWKASGVGGRHGAGGIRKFCRTQTILLTRFALRRDPLMFPRRQRESRLIEALLVGLHR